VIDRLHRFIGGTSDEEFGALALDLFRWQVARNSEYAAVAAGAAPDEWRRIPAVPVALFRDLTLTSFPVADAAVVFRTSGTTGRRGVVRLPDTALYDRGARRHAEAVLGPLPRVGVSLAPVAEDASLAHMCRDLVPDMPTFFSLEGGVDAAGAWAALRAATEPVFVPGTAFAFADLVRHASEPVALPEGSIVMVTGGFKGRRVALSDDELTRQLAALLPGARLVGEYGMTELSSQLWSARLGEPFTPPPWLGVVAVDPWLGEPVEGVGLLRFVDLANAWSVVAIETRDLGEVLPDGRVVLRGRLEGDQVRGCSLTVEEVWERGEGREAAPRAAPAPEGTNDARLRGLAMPFDPWNPGAEPDIPALSEDDAPRVDATLRALARLRRRPSLPLSMGLSASNGDQCLGLATGAITRDGLARELATPGVRPSRVSVVVPWGVFTTPIEWVAMLAAAGAAVHLKAPRRDPAMCAALAQDFSAEGLPVTWSTDRELPESDAVVAFGGDDTVAEIAAATPTARHALYGHRFSVAVVEDAPYNAQVLAWEHLLYDTRGCMAPVAVFVLGDGSALFESLADAMRLASLAVPAGDGEPELGPEARRRLGLARASGQAVTGDGWAVALLPAAHFTPVSLPRFVTLHPVPDAATLRGILSPWRDHLSTLGTDDMLRAHREGGDWLDIFSWFPRIDGPGRMQRPSFPRPHDGRPMLGSLMRQ
jgi:hypothetical protein